MHQNIEQTENLPSSFLLPAAQQIQPIEQGSIDNLCGLYAVVNALRLLTPASRGRDQKLFHAAITYLDDLEWLSSVITEGMHTALFSALARKIGESENFQVSRVASWGEKHRQEEAVIRAIVTGSPVLASIDPPLDHYSVICGYTATRWLLFDSYGYRWLSRARCSFGSRENARHIMLAWAIGAGPKALDRQPVIQEQEARQLWLPIPPTRQRSSGHSGVQS